MFLPIPILFSSFVHSNRNNAKWKCHQVLARQCQLSDQSHQLQLSPMTWSVFLSYDPGIIYQSVYLTCLSNSAYLDKIHANTERRCKLDTNIFVGQFCPLNSTSLLHLIPLLFPLVSPDILDLSSLRTVCPV